MIRRMVLTGMIAVVADPHTHVVLDRFWHDHCDTKPKNPVGYAQRIDITVSQKQDAGCDPPKERDGRQHRIGQVGEGE